MLIDDCVFYNSPDHISAHDSTATQIWNLLSTDQVTLNQCQFSGHRYVNVSMTQRIYTANTIIPSDSRYPVIVAGSSKNDELNVVHAITRLLFTHYVTDSAIYIEDIDYATGGRVGNDKDDYGHVQKFIIQHLVNHLDMIICQH